MPLLELNCELFSLTEIEVKWEQEENAPPLIEVTELSITAQRIRSLNWYHGYVTQSCIGVIIESFPEGKSKWKFRVINFEHSWIDIIVLHKLSTSWGAVHTIKSLSLKESDKEIVRLEQPQNALEPISVTESEMTLASSIPLGKHIKVLLSFE